MKTHRAGTVIFVLTLMCAAFTISSSAQTLTTLYDFCQQTGCADGAAPYGTLVQGADGNFYGTTSDIGSVGQGTVYKLSASGTFTLLHSFTGGQDGGVPIAGLIQARDGNFYGDTEGSGACGVAYKITASGTLTPVHAFAGGAHDGCRPFAPLMQASDGNFYGTTYFGGGSTLCQDGCGTVFKMTAAGAVTVLHAFCTQSGCPDGEEPQAGLVQGSDGNLYGVTFLGGANGFGSVFKITTSGTLTTLHSFNGTDGSEPTGGLVQGSDGNFYGTTSAGGTNSGGAVFKMTPSGTLTTLYSFCIQSLCRDGAGPTATLLQASDGNFYGTTSSGGARQSGTVFAITPEGTFSSLYSFCSLGGTGCTDGASPYAGLIQASDGKLYGVTTQGGNANFAGTAFSLQLTEETLTVSTVGNGTVTSTDGIINCPGTCSHSYLQNTQVTLNATPAAGWAFTGWSGACSGTGSCNVTMTQNLSVTATFTQLPVTLTVSTAGSGSVTSTDGFINCPGSCMHTYPPGSPVTLNANPAQGWVFSGWTGACSGVGACNLTMTQNLAVTAVFVEPGHGIQFTTVAPCRLVDTRQGNPIQGGTSESFGVPQLGGCNIPATAAAYSLNVTVVPHGHLGYLTIWPTGEAQPVVSTLNSPDGRTKANAAIVPAGTNGAVSVYVSDTSDVLLDINGYFTTPGAQTLQFYPLAPCRLVDTRGADGPLGGPRLPAQMERDFPLLMSNCIPQGLSPVAYSLNFTAVPNPSGQHLGYLTVWPFGETQPTVSTLNNPTGTTVANAAIVPAGSGGEIAVYASSTTDLLVDINGYFALPGQGGYSFYPAAPCRVYDSRNVGNGQPFMGERTLNVVGSPCAPPSSAKAYVFNATVVPSASLGYLTLWPDGQDQPVVSTLNARDGAITSNMAIVPNSNGSIDAYASGLTQLLLDISGYFAP